VTLRALKLPSHAWRALEPTFGERTRVLIWAGREDPQVPAWLRVRRSVELAGSAWKRIVELDRVSSLVGR
jgi:hypothetical protein